MGLLEAGLAEARLAQQKFDAIEAGRFRPGSRVLFPAAEIDSWVTRQAKAIAPRGLSDLHLIFGDASVTGTAVVDFSQFRESGAGEIRNWIAGNLLAGPRPVTVWMRVESRGGEARVDVERIEMAGVPVEGAVLQFLIRTWWPGVTIGEWFGLARHIDHIAVTPRGISVFVGKD